MGFWKDYVDAFNPRVNDAEEHDVFPVIFWVDLQLVKQGGKGTLV